MLSRPHGGWFVPIVLSIGIAVGVEPVPTLVAKPAVAVVDVAFAFHPGGQLSMLDVKVTGILEQLRMHTRGVQDRVHIVDVTLPVVPERTQRSVLGVPATVFLPTFLVFLRTAVPFRFRAT